MDMIVNIGPARLSFWAYTNGASAEGKSKNLGGPDRLRWRHVYIERKSRLSPSRKSGGKHQVQTTTLQLPN